MPLPPPSLPLDEPLEELPEELLPLEDEPLEEELLPDEDLPIEPELLEEPERLGLVYPLEPLLLYPEPVVTRPDLSDEDLLPLFAGGVYSFSLLGVEILVASLVRVLPSL